jgi:nucleotide-binding universal stress UspA family protein
MKVIIALDQTGFADQIIEAVTKRHWPIDTQFKVLTVLEPLQWQAPSCIEWNKIAEQVLEKRNHHAHEMLIDAKHKIVAAVSNCTVHVETKRGSPREQIVAAAIDWMPDKIILGAHGHSPNRLFAGSVSRSVAQHAICSVELIRLKNLNAKEGERKSASASAAVAKR